eukprot:1680299-Amphidinium_carterae.1
MGICKSRARPSGDPPGAEEALLEEGQALQSHHGAAEEGDTRGTVLAAVSLRERIRGLRTAVTRHWWLAA